jgi:hypothetical protein
MEFIMTVITPKSRRFNAARQQRLTFSRLLGATSLGAIACVATSGEVQAKVTVSHGNAAYTEAQ